MAEAEVDGAGQARREEAQPPCCPDCLACVLEAIERGDSGAIRAVLRSLLRLAKGRAS